MSINQCFSALKQGERLIYSPGFAIFSITGSDRHDFLQRMSTNNLDLLSEQAPLQSSFTNSKGRLIDHCFIFQQEKKIFLVSSHRDPLILKNWLSSYHFIEDIDLVLQNDREAFIVFSCADDRATNEHASLKIISFTLACGLSVDVSCTMNAPVAGVTITHEQFATLRIMALIPMAPHEINQDFMPQNIGLASCIADNKGCYIGQEVLAKALLYQKQVKILQGARLTAETYAITTPPMQALNGLITSVAPLFVEHEINALVVKIKEND